MFYGLIQPFNSFCLVGILFLELLDITDHLLEYVELANAIDSERLLRHGTFAVLLQPILDGRQLKYVAKLCAGWLLYQLLCDGTRK